MLLFSVSELRSLMNLTLKPTAVFFWCTQTSSERNKSSLIMCKKEIDSQQPCTFSSWILRNLKLMCKMFVWCYLVGSNILLRLCNTQHCYCLLLLNSKHKRKQGKEINTMFLLILFKDIKFVFISLQKAATFFCVKSYLFRFFLNINRVLWTEKETTDAW